MGVRSAVRTPVLRVVAACCLLAALTSCGFVDDQRTSQAVVRSNTTTSTVPEAAPTTTVYVPSTLPPDKVSALTRPTTTPTPAPTTTQPLSPMCRAAQVVSLAGAELQGVPLADLPDQLERTIGALHGYQDLSSDLDQGPINPLIASAEGVVEQVRGASDNAAVLQVLELFFSDNADRIRQITDRAAQLCPALRS